MLFRMMIMCFHQAQETCITMYLLIHRDLTPLPNMAFLETNDLVTVKKFLFNVKEKWYNIGLHLKVTPSELDQIQARHKADLDYDVCLREMLQIWLNHYPIKPTWGQLEDALREKDVGEDELADEGMAIVWGVHIWEEITNFISLLHNLAPYHCGGLAAGLPCIIWGGGGGGGGGGGAPPTHKINLKTELNSCVLKGKGRTISLFLHQKCFNVNSTKSLKIVIFNHLMLVVMIVSQFQGA